MNPQPNLPETRVLEATQQTWGLALQPAGCPRCHQAYLVPGNQIGQACPGCGQARLEPQPVILRNEPPELLVPFKQGQSALAGLFKRFTQGVWLHSDDFTPQHLLQRARPIYWPMWLVDGDLSGDWQAEVGYDYQVKSSQESYDSGNWRTRELIETRIRWEKRLGQMRRHYNNAAAPALNEHAALASALGAYELKTQPYTPQMVGAALLRVPDLNPENAWPLAQSALHECAADECRQAAGAQHVRAFSIHASYEALNWTQLLLPMYASFYTDDNGRPQMVLVNGQNGQVCGRRLASQRKGWQLAMILAAVAAVLFLIGLGGTLLGAVMPPLVVVGTIFILLAIALGLFAIVPAVWPWQWNRKQRG